MHVFLAGARGLGAELSRWFGGRGAAVSVGARTRAEVERAAALAGARGLRLQLDLDDRASVDAAVAQAVREHGPIDLCVAAHTSGVGYLTAAALGLDPALLGQALLGTSVRALALLQAVVPHLAPGGAFVQIGTGAGQRLSPGSAGRAAPQAALRALVLVAAQELKERGVHVVYLAVEGQLATAASAGWIAKHGAARAIPPDEVARALELLHGQDPRAWTHELSLRPAAAGAV